MTSTIEIDRSNEAARMIEDAKRSGAPSLDLTRFSLSTIPDSIGHLTNLRRLNLSGNRISAIPDFLAQLLSLQELILSGNRIRTLPNSFAQLANLKFLNLFANQIAIIPAPLTQLENLRILDLSANQIRVIPDSIAQLANLVYLDLSSNLISTLPDSLRRLSQLTRLHLGGNKRLGIPEEILRSSGEPKPAEEILRYYFAQREGAKPLNEAKLILVGNGGVGKTSLVKTLTTGKFDPREETTQGIKISDWSCPLNSEDIVTIHVWDFGGQEMMHATHQFFLTARSLYLLVLSRRLGSHDEEADYWLRLIRAFGGKDAPVLVVLNKQKTEPFDVNRGGWLEKYAENIKGFVQTDCAESKSVMLFREAIEEQLRCMKSLKASFPTRWFKIKEELAQMKTDYVSFEDYRAICQKYGEDDLESQNSLSGYLHDLGIALNYSEDHRLRFGYVLKPEWVTEGIYALLHAFVSSKGLFTPGEAQGILEKKYSGEAVHFLLGLMEQFELSFPLGDVKNHILIPELLDDRQPSLAGEFKPTDCLNFGYRYLIVPGGLLPRFIVRTHHLSEPAARWKSGVILVDGVSGCRALVRTDAPDRQVRIHVDGPEESRRDLLAIIRHNFDVIHHDYEFKPEDLAYPAGLPDKPLPLSELEALRREGDVTARVVLQNKTVIKPDIADVIRSVESPLTPVRIFLSYSHDDEKHIDELRKDLKLMERNGLILPWYDRELSAGEKWNARILQELAEADVIVCQLSRDFLDSDFCTLIELDTAIKRKEAGEAELIAYVLKDCAWKDVARLNEFQVLPKDGKPLSRWRTKDEYWQAVAEGIKQALKKLRPTQKDRPRLQ